MRNLILFGLLIILLLAAQFASAKTVDEVIEKYIRARGGRDKLTSVKSIYMEGVTTITGNEMTVRIIKEQGKLSRTENENAEANEFVLITDKDAWTFFPHISAAINKIPVEELGQFQTETDIAGPLVDYIAKGHKAELLGKDAVDGNNCYKIKLTTKEGKEILFWVDTATYLVNQSSCAPFGNYRETDKETTIYRNYKEVDGIRFAHSFETKITGTNPARANAETLFYKIIVNPVIDPDVFFPE